MELLGQPLGQVRRLGLGSNMQLPGLRMVRLNYLRKPLLECRDGHNAIPAIHRVLNEERAGRQGRGDIGNITHFENSRDNNIIRRVSKLVIQDRRVTHQSAPRGDGVNVVFVQSAEKRQECSIGSA